MARHRLHRRCLAGCAVAAASVITIAASGTLNVTDSITPSASSIFQLSDKAVLEIHAITGTTGDQIRFLSAANSTLIIDSGSNFGINGGTARYTGPTIVGFAAGDQIDLKSLAFSTKSSAPVYDASTGLLQLYSGSANVATLAFLNSSLGSGTFHLASDPYGGTMITHS
jgi:hypothetical protein